MGAAEELTVSWVKDGVLEVKELDKVVLSQGAWATVAFLFQEIEPGTTTYRPPKVALRRYKKRGDRYVVDSRFVITGDQQATDLASALTSWFTTGGKGRPALEEP